MRVNLNLNLQIAADELLGDQKGAIVLMNAQTGEIYTLASHPSFDANTLEEQWESLMASPDAPFVEPHHPSCLSCRYVDELARTECLME